jgi:peptidoglycan LD-endopeptidase LytH
MAWLRVVDFTSTAALAGLFGSAAAASEPGPRQCVFDDMEPMAIPSIRTPWLRRLGLLGVVTVAACGPIDDLRERMRGGTPHEDYVEALRAAGLLDSALGQDWIAAAERALREPLPQSLPAAETGYFDAGEANAISLRVPLQRGQRIIIDVDLEPDSTALVFVDVFRVAPDTLSEPVHVAAADSGTRSFSFEPARTGDHIVRVQPELLRGGRYTLRAHSEPALTFPVHGAGERAIGSRFGAARDGGAREHHGIDIFAPRGTPVIAAASGTVNRVRETPRGGLVVWLRDEQRGQSLYYAHLDSQLATEGQRVQPGDTIGTVGNTGNARSTPPHLHFGIYRRGEGPVDPYDFVRRPPITPPTLAADTALFGEWARVLSTTALVGVAANEHAIAASTAVRIRGGSGSWYRVELPDGTPGWIATAMVTRGALAAITASAECVLRDRPAAHAAEIETIRAGAALSVVARFGDYALVRNGTVSGWSDCA